VSPGWHGFVANHVLVHHDLLSCGPLPALESLDGWRDVRESYLRSLDIEWPSFSFAEQDRDLLTNRERLRSAETITLWLGTGLAEQLMLVWVIAVLRKLGADAGRCRASFSSTSIASTKSSQSASWIRCGSRSILHRRDSQKAPYKKPRRRGKRSLAPEPDELLAFLPLSASPSSR
jgi:hypothetical protein